MKIGVIGLGLIGGSIARGLVKAGHEVLGWDIDPDAMREGVVLHAYTDVLTEASAKTVDILIVALTPEATVATWEEWAPRLRVGTILMDVAGTKRYIVREAERLRALYPHLNWVCTHPMAGREYSGIRHSQAGLFEHSTLLVVPVGAPEEAIETAIGTMSGLGFGRVVLTTAEEHDRIIAFTSQLAHIVSNAYIMSDTAMDQAGYSAGSFRDMTRVARINGKMWSELFVQNKDHLTVEIDRIVARLVAMREAIEAEDRATIEKYLAEGNARKEEADRQSRRKD